MVRVKSDATGLEFVDSTSVGENTNTFTGLTDTPANYTNQGSKFVRVKSDASGLEFVDNPDTNTKYDIVTSASGDNIKLKLDASTGASDDDDITITAGTNITLTDNSNGGFTIASSATLSGTIAQANLVKVTTTNPGESEYHNITFVPQNTNDFTPALNNSSGHKYVGLEIDDVDNMLAYSPGSLTFRGYRVQPFEFRTWSGYDNGDAGQVLTSGGDGNQWTWTTPSSLSGIAVNAFSKVAVSGNVTLEADSSSDTLTFAAGSNITLSTTNSTDTVTISATGSVTNAFTTIAVSGDNSIEADSSSDTLTFAAGNNIQLSTNIATDTLTISANDVLGTISRNGAYTLSRGANGDNGKFLIFGTTAGDITVPHGQFQVGDIITITTGVERTIKQSTNTLIKFAGSQMTGDRTIANRGLITLICIADGTRDDFLISGSGLT